MKKGKGKKKEEAKAKKKDRAPDVASLLLSAIHKGGVVKATAEHFSDNSSRWVTIKMGRYIFELSFNMEGTTLTDVTLSKEVVDVVDTQMLFDSRKKKQEKV